MAVALVRRLHAALMRHGGRFSLVVASQCEATGTEQRIDELTESAQALDEALRDENLGACLPALSDGRSLLLDQNREVTYQAVWEATQRAGRLGGLLILAWIGHGITSMETSTPCPTTRSRHPGTLTGPTTWPSTSRNSSPRPRPGTGRPDRRVLRRGRGSTGGRLGAAEPGRAAALPSTDRLEHRRARLGLRLHPRHLRPPAQRRHQSRRTAVPSGSQAGSRASQSGAAAGAGGLGRHRWARSVDLPERGVVLEGWIPTRFLTCRPPPPEGRTPAFPPAPVLFDTARAAFEAMAIESPVQWERLPASERSLLGPLGLLPAGPVVRLALDGFDQLSDTAAADLTDLIDRLRHPLPGSADVRLVVSTRPGAAPPPADTEVSVDAASATELHAYLDAQHIPDSLAAAIVEGSWSAKASRAPPSESKGGLPPFFRELPAGA